MNVFGPLKKFKQAKTSKIFFPPFKAVERYFRGIGEILTSHNEQITCRDLSQDKLHCCVIRKMNKSPRCNLRGARKMCITCSIIRDGNLYAFESRIMQSGVRMCQISCLSQFLLHFFSPLNIPSMQLMAHMCDISAPRGLIWGSLLGFIFELTLEAKAIVR